MLILDTGPGVDQTARYVLGKDHAGVEAFLAEAAEQENFPSFLVFPQVVVGAYRLDFVIAARNPWSPPPCPFTIAVIEADGGEWHGTPEQVRHDLRRELEVRQMTRWPVLRFSGSEIKYARETVGTIIAAFVEASMVNPGIQPGSPRHQLKDQVRRLAELMAFHPAGRAQYVESVTERAVDHLTAALEEMRNASGLADPDSWWTGADQDD